MKKNIKIKILLFAVIVLFIFSSQVALAWEVNDYPNIPGLPNLKNMDPDRPDLGMYIGYFFGLGCYLAGIIALISFVAGAIQLIFPSPEYHNSGKDRMKGSILGLVLTLSAFAILQTINPKFVEPTLTPLPGVQGVYLINGRGYLRPVSQSVADTSEALKDGYNKIIYCCNPPDERGNCPGGTGTPFWIWGYKLPNFGSADNYLDARTTTVYCGQTLDVSGIGSFKMDYEKPGVYYSIAECGAGYYSTVKTTSENSISDPFAQRIKAVVIINDTINNYGIIFHKEKKYADGGECTEPIRADKNSNCINLPNGFQANSADIFVWNKDDWKSSGDGITFYSDADGWNAGKNAGYYNIFGERIKDYLSVKAKNLPFDYAYTNSTLAYLCPEESISCEDAKDGEDCCPCDNPRDWGFTINCAGSIEFYGKYLVGLYTQMKDEKGKATGLYCQTFIKDVADASLQSYLPKGKNSGLDHINIIPIIR